VAVVQRLADDSGVVRRPAGGREQPIEEGVYRETASNKDQGKTIRGPVLGPKIAGDVDTSRPVFCYSDNGCCVEETPTTLGDGRLYGRSRRIEDSGDDVV
jgi:hypothetical protein